jgi:glycosyltransferase involved in cell wall biosynthesis
MKILLISSLYGLNGFGAGIAVQNLAEGLTARGHAVTVVTHGLSRRAEIEIENGVKVYRFRPFNIYPIQQRESRPAWQKIVWQFIDFYNPAVVSPLRRILGDEQADVINIHKMRGFSGAVWTSMAASFPGRLVQTCHDFESYSPILQGQVGLNAIGGHPLVYPYLILRRLLTRGISFVTAPSNFALQTVLSKGMFPGAESIVVPNSHGMSRTQLLQLKRSIEQQLKETKRPTRFLYLGRLEKEKGVELICKVFAQLTEKYSDIRLDLIGSGSLDADLRKHYGSVPGLFFQGLLYGEEKSAWIAGCDVMLIPSQWPEVSPLVILEAYAHGKPVITSRIGGMPELVQTGRTGKSIDPFNLNAWVEAMEDVVIHRKDYNQMRPDCFEAAKAYSVETICDHYFSIYSKLLSVKNNPP